MLPKSVSHYEILEIEPDATPRQIHDAYLRLKSAYSRSSSALYGLGDFGDESNTQKLLTEIDLAFQTLSDPIRRKEYDERHGIVIHAPRTEGLTTSLPERPTVPSIASTPSLTSASSPQPRIMPVSRSQEPPIAYGPETEWRGELLRQAREKMEISLEEMSNFTKVSKNYLRAIEDEQFEKLPAPVFLRGFLIQMARKLRLPEDKVSSSFLARAKQHVSK